MQISEKTKISALIKANPEAIDAIASISSHFEKLRNPLLRKILASRVTIADAARIGNSSVEVFFEKLRPIGFTIEESEKETQPVQAPKAEVPAFLKNIPAALLSKLDVRVDILSGNDPFQKIISAIDAIPEGGALCLINTFEPTPLIAILKKRGLNYFTEVLSPDLVHTYFFRETTETGKPLSHNQQEISESVINFEARCAEFSGHIS